MHEGELSYFCEVMRQSHIGAEVLGREALFERAAANDPFAPRGLAPALLHSLRGRTLFRLTTPAELTYCLLPLPGEEPTRLLLVGPYRAAVASPDRLMELGEALGIPPSRQRYFTEYYEGIPHVAPDSPLLLMLFTLCERLFGSPSYAVEELHPAVAAPSAAPPAASLSEDADLRIRAMEQRYAFENELCRAVEQGQLHMEERLLGAFSASLFEKRAADPLRNAQNYGIIMNTLLRKAAERGGVHPVHLDRISSSFAAAIEALPSLDKTQELMLDMFRTYCHLVRDHSTGSLPAAVQATVLRIHADLSADLSAGALAEAQGVTTAYLSTAFRRATGVTLTEYVRARRMKHASHLLTHTALQIQTVALHCGILDLRYFSRLFKQQYGKTPSQYREGAKK